MRTLSGRSLEGSRRCQEADRALLAGLWLMVHLTQRRSMLLLAAAVALIASVGVSQAAPALKGQVTLTTPAGDEVVVSTRSRFFGYQSAVDRDLTGGQLAYDYSVHIIKDGPWYRLFCGGRWRRPGVPYADGDHVMQYISQTGRGGTWKRVHFRPEFWQGGEEGAVDSWYAGHYLEPEVVKVGGTYYMYTQVGISPGRPLDVPGLKAEGWCDRIQLHTSRDALHWHRWSKERGVVVNLDDPTHTALHHQEVIYVPWDPDGRPWWMYVAVNGAGGFLGFVRLRSDDPTTYDWEQQEPVYGLAQLGNQIAYARQMPGGPLFVRITFAGNEERRAVPALQFSWDGLKWMWGEGGPLLLDGSKDNDRNPNCYFLGISTINGTGELEYRGDGRYYAIYGATTSKSPVAPDIFWSEVGVGEVVLQISED
ncbi:MAG: hypothetical protein J7M26_06190 [Armatimonadetes bacterium]|nr:hypothetical protein [Armatimonadota bacterium]